MVLLKKGREELRKSLVAQMKEFGDAGALPCERGIREFQAEVRLHRVLLELLEAYSKAACEPLWEEQCVPMECP